MAKKSDKENPKRKAGRKTTKKRTPARSRSGVRRGQSTSRRKTGSRKPSKARKTTRAAKSSQRTRKARKPSKQAKKRVLRPKKRSGRKIHPKKSYRRRKVTRKQRRKPVAKRKPIRKRKYGKPRKKPVRRKAERKRKPVRKPRVKKPSVPAYLKALKTALKYAPKEKRDALNDLYKAERKRIGKEFVPIDKEAPITSLDIEKLTNDELKQEELRLLAEQYHFKGMRDALELKKNKALVGNHLRRISRVIQKIQEKLGTFEKPKGFEKESYTIGKTEVDNVYVWNAKSFIDDLIDGGFFDKFIIGGIEYDVKDVVGIHIELDELEAEADMKNIYYFRISKNFAEKTVKIDLNY